MKKSPNATPPIRTETVPRDFVPSQDQIDALARRLMPEIKKFFADVQVQKEFTEWKEERNK